MFEKFKYFILRFLISSSLSLFISFSFYIYYSNFLILSFTISNSSVTVKTYYSHYYFQYSISSSFAENKSFNTFVPSFQLFLAIGFLVFVISTADGITVTVFYKHLLYFNLLGESMSKLCKEDIFFLIKFIRKVFIIY